MHVDRLTWLPKGHVPRHICWCPSGATLLLLCSCVEQTGAEHLCAACTVLHTVAVRGPGTLAPSVSIDAVRADRWAPAFRSHLQDKDLPAAVREGMTSARLCRTGHLHVLKTAARPRYGVLLAQKISRADCTGTLPSTPVHRTMSCVGGSRRQQAARLCRRRSRGAGCACNLRRTHHC
jgi:hypothetical protein